MERIQKTITIYKISKPKQNKINRRRRPSSDKIIKEILKIIKTKQ